MCGIAGIYGTENLNLLNKMLDVTPYRGPDDTGTYSDNKITMGVNRLSIVDVDGGSQPMFNEKGNISVVLNGEIYNYKGIKNRLLEEGHNFKTDCDTEILPHLYEEYGEGMVNKLKGMFAFALWDSSSQKLILARDRLGIKPLYFTQYKEKVLFSSEIKSLLQDPELETDLSEKAIKQFLKLRYIPGQDTAFNSIKEVKPGEMLVFKNGMERKEYWKRDGKVEDIGNSRNGISEDLEKAVEDRLMGEVPIGVFVSGGLDSTSVLHFAEKHMEKTPKTYSISFSKDRSDESDYAKFVSDHYSTDHTNIQFGGMDMEMLRNVVQHLDEPMADPTSIPTYMLSERASRECKVVLTGEGADEVFGGYEQYRYMQIKNRLPKTIQLLSQCIPKGKRGTFLGRVTRSLRSNDNGSTYSKLISIFDEDEMEEYFNVRTDIPRLIGSYFKDEDIGRSMMSFDVNNWLPNDLLMKLDRMTMANSLEARVPFLDMDVYRNGTSSSLSSKVKPGRLKSGLNKSMKDKVPRKIRKRKKQRFFVPLNSYFTGEFRETSLQILENPDIFKEMENIEFSGAQKILDKMNSWRFRFIENRSDKSRMYYLRQIWNILILETWYQEFRNHLT